MRLTIDTKHDSAVEIRHAIEILTKLLEGKEPAPASLLKDNAVDTAPLMGMFETEEKFVPDTAPDFSSFLNLVEKKQEQKEKMPRVEFF